MVGKIMRLTVAQALVRFLVNQMTTIDGEKLPIFAGCWAIFGHGNVAGIGEALYPCATGFPPIARTTNRPWPLRPSHSPRRAFAADSWPARHRSARARSIWSPPPPSPMSTVCRSCCCLATSSPIDCPTPCCSRSRTSATEPCRPMTASGPVSRYFDRINRAEQLIPALQRAMHVLTDPAECGPVTLAMCQDVQTEAYDWPESLFAEKIWAPRRVGPDENELAAAVAAIKAAKKPMIIAGGGALYSEARPSSRPSPRRTGFRSRSRRRVSRRSTKPTRSPSAPSASPARRRRTRWPGDADLLLAIGTRFQDFTTGSWALFKTGDLKIVALNVTAYDTAKHNALPACLRRQGRSDAAVRTPQRMEGRRGRGRAREAGKGDLVRAAEQALAPTNAEKPSDAQVIGAVARTLGGANSVVVNAAGGLPGELDKLWPATTPGSYHMEYGFSCMGYEIAGGIGVKMARPDKEVVVMVGDGSYMMMNSEIATSVSLGQKLIIVVLDNHGFGCINRLQMATGGANFNNLWQDCTMVVQPDIDFRKHAESMGAIAVKVVVDRRSRSRAQGGQRQRSHHGHRHRDPSADHNRSGRVLVGRRRRGGVAARRGGESARGVPVQSPPAAGVRLRTSHGSDEPRAARLHAPGRRIRTMPNLRVRPKGTHGLVTEVTPESAGWSYVGFALHRLERRRKRRRRDGQARGLSGDRLGQGGTDDRRRGFRRDRRTHRIRSRVPRGPPMRRLAHAIALPRSRRLNSASARRRALPATRRS